MTASSDYVHRFSVSDRLEHVAQMGSFIVLAATGLVQRYDGAWLSERLVSAFGGIEMTRDLHRVFATILMIATVYHFGAAFYRRYVLGHPRTMFPSWSDLKAIKGSLSYVMGSTPAPPRQGRFTWEEKVEYWSLVWGTVVMIVTGYMLWNPIATTNFFPGQWIPTAKAIHGGEALLAALAIAVWHIYHVHIRHFNTSIFTGKLSRHEMEEYHPLELEVIDAGGYPERSAAELTARVRRFAAIYGVSAVVLLAGVYLFVTFEETSLETITPPEQVAVFAPIETLAPGAATTVAPNPNGDPGVGTDATWAGDIAPLLDPACTVCHGSDLQSAGLDLSSYEAALAGGDSGEAVIPGNPNRSLIVRVIEPGDHFATLAAGDLQLLRGWIDAGAVDGTPLDPVAIGWNDGIAEFFDPTCTGCHGERLQSGGLDLTSYRTAVAGGDSGPGVVPGTSEASLIVRVLERGGHAAALSADDLAVLKDWIDAGASEAGGAVPPVAGGAGWDAIAAMFDASCSGCHGSAVSSGGLDLSSYAAAVAGGGSGAGVVPGDSGASVIVQVLEAGGHPAALSADDLAALKDWIDAGADENGGGAPPAAGAATWNDVVAGFFDPTCTGCHASAVSSGGLDLSSYAAAVAGGGSGAGVVPGDSGASVIVQVLEGGGHPAALSADDLAVLKDWIDAGADEG